MAVRRRDDPRSAIHKCGLTESRESRPISLHPLDECVRPANHRRSIGIADAPDLDVGIEPDKQSLEITGARSGQKRVDDRENRYDSEARTCREAFLTIEELQHHFEIERLGDERAASPGEELLQIGAHNVTGEKDDAASELRMLCLPLLEDMLPG